MMPIGLWEGRKLDKPRALLIERSREGLQFLLGAADGITLGSGAFPIAVVASDQVVFDDYSLLRSPELLGTSPSGRVGIIRPESFVANPAISRSALSRWFDTTLGEQKLVDQAGIANVAPLLELRRELEVAARQSADRVLRHLGGSYPEYAAALFEGEAISTNIAHFLVEYPTPGHLDSENIVHLRSALDSTFSLKQSNIVETIMSIPRFSGMARVQRERSSHLVRSASRSLLLYRSQINELDWTIYDGVDSSWSESIDQPPRNAFTSSIFSFSGMSSDSECFPSNVRVLLRRLRDLERRSLSPERDPAPDFDEYISIAAAIERVEDLARDPAQVMRWLILGQRLALASTRHLEASGLRDKVKLLLKAPTAAKLSPMEILSAEINNAITGLVTTNVPTGFGTLRQLTESEYFSSVDPDLQSEALGLVAIAVLLYGEAGDHCELFAAARDLASRATSEIGQAGISIADMFLLSGPGADQDAFHDATRRADKCSTGTYMRPYFSFLMTHIASVTKEHEVGLRHYRDLLNGGTWATTAPSLHAQSQLVHVMLLAGSGQIGSARRELHRIVAPTDLETAAPFALQSKMLERALELLTGDYNTTLEATNPGGPLDEESFDNIRARRFLPAVTILRATALIRSGSPGQAASLFRHATELAIESGEWHVLLAFETPEFRVWFAELDESELPPGLDHSTWQTILGRPLYFSHMVPRLTGQQQRILRLLAMGQTPDAIKTELRVSANTLKTHMRRLYRRLGVRSRHSAVEKADAYGIIL